MAKEMMIVFVYDTLRCLAEADDPADAVLYFHPGWVSDSQRMSLCGQLMGVSHCLKALFSAPRVLALQSGKFVVQEYGRYILAVGSDRNIPDWMLKSRADKLTSLIKVYHCDLQTLAAQFPGENNPRFSEKLYQMFETYLPVLQYGCYMFQTVPLLNLPKSATNIFLESMQVLEHCQRTDGVLGGTILYNNKIVATQLSSKLTSHLSMVDPYRIKSPAEALETAYELPQGTQLLVVYIRKKYYETLKRDADRIRGWYLNGFEKVKTNKNAPFKHAKEPVLGGMKRDKSLLFTAVPEEEIHTGSPSPSSPHGTTKSTLKESILTNPSNMPDVVPFTIKPRVRPNKLSLSFKNSVARDSIDEDGVAPPIPSGPVFTGQTSVCSTPMLEFKRLHGNVMSICRNSDDQLLAEALNVPVNVPEETPTEPESVFPPHHVNTQLDITTAEKARKISKELNVTGENMIAKPSVTLRKFNSLSDINSNFNHISHLAAMRFGKSGLTKKNLSLNCDDSPSEDAETMKRISVTITDPYYPVFRSDGVPISKNLFNEYLVQNFAEMTKETEDALKLPIADIAAKNNEPFKGFDSDMKASPVRRKSHDVKMSTVFKSDSGLPPKPDKLRRKSLCLPLKSLGTEKVNTEDSFFESQNRKKLTGVQLTPLMEKLSHLAFSEKSSGYSSRGVTPMEFKDFTLSTPCIEKTVVFPEEKEKNNPEMLDCESDSDDDTHNSSFSIDCVKSVLYVCGLQNISVILLMDELAATDQNTINSLWRSSTETLGAIEQLCMEPLPGCEESSEAYSYLSLDPQWGPVKKGGPWASGDVATMGYIHKDFQDDPSLTEIIIRNEESLVFGTSCGGAEIFYQESGCKQAGLPTPADLMGTAPLKAKRRLQRDHTITIF